MQRWQITAGLGALALAGVLLAPRLTAALQLTPAVTPPAPQPSIIDLPVGMVMQRRAPVKATPPPPVTAAPVPANSGHLIVEAGLDRTAVLDGRREERFLAIRVTAPANIGKSYRRPVDLSVVMDTSGSMAARGKIDYAKQAAKMLASEMTSDDVYSLVTFSDTAQTVISGQSVSNLDALHNAIDRIQERNSTNLYAGLELGGREAKEALNGKNIGRIVLLSDGKANHGRTDAASMVQIVSKLAGQGITVSTVGLGLDYNEDLLAQLADVGGGSYDFVDDPRRLRDVFTDELSRTSSVVARNTRVQVHLPPGVEGLEILGWDAQRTADGWSVNLGDVYAGQTRKIIARVRVTGTHTGSMNVASVQANYLDLIDDRRAVSRASAAALITADTGIVTNSVHRNNSIDANKAWGSHWLYKSTKAYEAGDISQARTLAAQGASSMRGAAVQFDAPDLEEIASEAEAAAQDYQVNPPTSSAGRRRIKSSKEWSRDNAR